MQDCGHKWTNCLLLMVALTDRGFSVTNPLGTVREDKHKKVFFLWSDLVKFSPPPPYGLVGQAMGGLAPHPFSGPTTKKKTFFMRVFPYWSVMSFTTSQYTLLIRGVNY